MNSKAPPPLDSSRACTLCIFHVPPAEDTCLWAADGAAALRLAPCRNTSCWQRRARSKPLELGKGAPERTASDARRQPSGRPLRRPQQLMSDTPPETAAARLPERQLSGVFDFRLRRGGRGRNVRLKRRPASSTTFSNQLHRSYDTIWNSFSI